MLGLNFNNIATINLSNAGAANLFNTLSQVVPKIKPDEIR